MTKKDDNSTGTHRDSKGNIIEVFQESSRTGDNGDSRKTALEIIKDQTVRNPLGRSQSGMQNSSNKQKTDDKNLTSKME